MSKRRPLTPSSANFAQTVHASIPRSKFMRGSGLKTTFNCGDLVPVYVDEVLPGDTRQIDLKMLARLSTPLFPTMDNINLEFYAIYCPYRLVWDGWEELMGENKTSAWTPSEPPALVPVYDDVLGSDNSSLVLSKSIGDYMGLPVGMDVTKCPVSVLPFRAYGLIWNDWFRDENLQAPIPLNKGNTVTSVDIANYGINFPLLKVNKYHDYFTSALPEPLKGDSPLIPIELNSVIPLIVQSDEFGNSFATRFRPSYSQEGFVSGSPLGVSRAAIENGTKCYLEDDNGVLMTIDPQSSGLVADPRGLRLNDTTIGELRTLFQIQKLLERDARGGTRYIELLKSHFGVDAGDYRLQRPEFLGHYKTLVGIQSVPQTSSTNETSPQGNLAAYSLTTGSSRIVNKTFVEHGVLFIFAVARQVKTYQQGLNRMWSRRERFDFYWPELAHISEQPIKNKEIFAFGDDVDEIFGYQECWAEYRFRPNMVTGQMRSGVENSLDVWHYADFYTETPRLSAEWITDNSAVNVNRTLAVDMSQDDQIRMDIEFMDIATRPMPVCGIPGLVDHF